MSLKEDSHPASAAFDAISQTLANDEAARKNAIKSGKTIFALNLKNKEGAVKTWYIDLKNTGTVGKGNPPEDAGITLSLSDADFGQLASGKANAQRLFMGGKLKIKGDAMKAAKLEPLLKKARPSAKL